MTEFMMTAWVALVGLVVWYVKERHSFNKETTIRLNKLETAIQAMIRSQLSNDYTTIMDRGTVSPAQKQALLELHETYVTMGGNGPTSHLVDDVKRMKPQ